MLKDNFKISLNTLPLRKKFNQRYRKYFKKKEISITRGFQKPSHASRIKFPVY